MFLMYLRKSRADGEHETVEEVLAKHYKILQDYAAAKLGGAILRTEYIVKLSRERLYRIDLRCFGSWSVYRVRASRECSS